MVRARTLFQCPRCAYAFDFCGYNGFKPTLTAREEKEREFENERSNRKSESFFKGFGELDKDWWKQRQLERQLERQREDEERRILRAMGDDSQEKADNIKKDKDRRQNLWLDTPVKMHYNEAIPHMNTIRLKIKEGGYAILPVADKKWQGKL